MDYKNILVLIDKDENKKLSELSKELIGKAREMADVLSEEVITLAIGNDMKEVAQDAIYYGADKSIYVNDKLLENYTTIPYTRVLDEIIEKYEPQAVLIGANADGRDLGGRICARRNIGLVADCSDIELTEDKKDTKWVRPTLDGKLFSDIRISSYPKIETVASGVFRINKKDENRAGELIEEKVEIPESDILTIVKEFIKSPKEDKSLSDCDIIVSGGMGIGEKDNWHLIEELASAVHGLVGATKPVCDMGWVPVEEQIGSTGVRVAPKLYIAVGISGAIQHIAGIKKSDLIIAINNDPEAPIFKHAHYGLVGDLFEIVPMLTEKLKEIEN